MQPGTTAQMDEGRFARSSTSTWTRSMRRWSNATSFENYDAIIDAACDAWRKLIAQPQRITSIGMRMAHIGQPS